MPYIDTDTEVYSYSDCFACMNNYYGYNNYLHGIKFWFFIGIYMYNALSTYDSVYQYLVSTESK